MEHQRQLRVASCVPRLSIQIQVASDAFQTAIHLIRFALSRDVEYDLGSFARRLRRLRQCHDAAITLDQWKGECRLVRVSPGKRTDADENDDRMGESHS